MSYARWATEKELKEELTKVNLKKKVEKSGIPLMNDKDDLYIYDKPSHTLVIGSSGSGKTQTTILPVMKLGMKSNENLVINDPKGELYELTSKEFKDNGYKTITLNFDNPTKGNKWNPLTIPYELYKNGNDDKAINMIEDLGYYLLFDPNDVGDPFWINSTIDYFTGIVLYLFENMDKKDINIKKVYEIANLLTENNDIFKNIPRSSNIYINLRGTLESPKETKGSIMSVFNQKIKKYICYKGLSDMILSDDFDIKDITKEKVCIYIINNNLNNISNLIPLFVNQIYDIANLYDNKKSINLLLDEFDTMIPIRNFAKLINYSRSLNIKFISVIKSYRDLVNMYGKENAEVIKMCFNNIIYLLSNDIYTLDEISKLCGNVLKGNVVVPLITIEELKVMENFEAIVLMPRIMPIKTKLLPYYKYN